MNNALSIASSFSPRDEAMGDEGVYSPPPLANRVTHGIHTIGYPLPLPE